MKPYVLSIRDKIIQEWKNTDKRSGITDTAFWKGMAHYWRIYDLHAKNSEEQAAVFTGYLRSRGLLQKDQTVLDIGCGKGRIAVEFAKSAGHVTGLDVSPDLCEDAKSRAEALGLDNTTFITGDFRSFEPKDKGLPEKYDLVFASKTPVTESYEGFRKLASLSRGYCFQAILTESSIPMLQALAEQIVPGAVLQKRERTFRLMLAFDLLCLEGFQPEVFYYKSTVLNSIPANELGLTYIKKLCPFHAFTKEEEEKLLRLLCENADRDGVLTAEMNTVLGCLFWHVEDGQR